MVWIVSRAESVRGSGSSEFTTPGPMTTAPDDLEVDGFPDAGIAVRNKRVAVGRVLAGPLIAEVVPVDPVLPAVRQFHTVDVLQRSLRGDLDGQGVAFSGLDPLRDVELVGVVHANDLLVVRDHVGRSTRSRRGS